MILRCYNATSSERTGTWRVTPSPKQAWRVRADETTPEPVPIVSKGVILFTAGPHEIVTHLIPGSAVAS